MMYLTIGETEYAFNFGIGFVREINKKVKMPVNNTGTDRDAGLQWYAASLIDGDVLALVDVLDVANRGMTPRVTRAAIDAFVDDPETDIDEVFDNVMDFLSAANACKKTIKKLKDAMDQEAGLQV